MFCHHQPDSSLDDNGPYFILSSLISHTYSHVFINCLSLIYCTFVYFWCLCRSVPSPEGVFFFNSCFLLSTSFSFFQAHKKFFLYSCRSIFLNRHSYSASPEFVAEPGALNWECLNGLPVNNHLPTLSSLTLYTIALTNAIDHYRSNAFSLPFPCFGRL